MRIECRFPIVDAKTVNIFIFCLFLFIFAVILAFYEEKEIEADINVCKMCNYPCLNCRTSTFCIVNSC